MFKKVLIGLGLVSVLSVSVLACDCQKVDNQAFEIGKSKQVIIVINNFNLDDENGKTIGEKKASEDVKINEETKIMSTSASLSAFSNK